MDQQIIHVSTAEAPSIPTHLLQSLPDVVKREIGITAKKTDLQGREMIVNRIISMLDVKFDDKQARDLAVGEYKTFIRDYDLTAAEIFAAYKMALREQLFDESGKRIEVYPNLSLITAGKVLNSYVKYKNEDKAYEIGKSKIKAFLNPPQPEPTAEEKAKQREKLKINIRECFEKHGECEYAFLIYDEMKASGAIEQYRTREAVAEIQDRLMRRFLAKELTRHLFYNSTELKQLSDKFYAGEKYKLPDLVKQEIKNEILKCYFTSK